MNFKRGDATSLKAGAEICLDFCGPKLKPKGWKGKVQLTEGKNNANRWMCRCFDLTQTGRKNSKILTNALGYLLKEVNKLALDLEI